jgi:hypothetical protein
MARSHAPEAFPRFARYGNNVLTVWDEEDPSSAPYLQSAVLLGMGLVTRTKTLGDAADISALRDLDSRIEQELERLAKMEKHSESIKKSANNISEEIRKAQDALDRMVRNAKSTLNALNSELQEEAVERKSPISLPTSLSTVTNAILELPRKTGTDE